MRAAAFGCMVLWLVFGAVAAASDEILEPGFDDSPLEEPVKLPDWFKLSFLDLQEDMADARRAGKRGLMLYFGQKFCPYCKVLVERDLAREDVQHYLQQHFDVVAVDTRGSRLATDFDGTVLPESEYAQRMEAELTPTLLFFADQGQVALRLTGYHPVYELRAALEYVADGHFRNQRFKDYLARAEPTLRPEGELNSAPFLSPPPHALDRSRFPAQRPLLVMFEQPECHACDVLHVGPLQADANRALLRGFEVVQLDVNATTPVITPSGQGTTARAWADRLGLYYTPTLVLYDPAGREIMRVDSVVHFNRLGNLLRYVLEQGYLRFDSYQEWRDQHPEQAADAS